MDVAVLIISPVPENLPGIPVCLLLRSDGHMTSLGWHTSVVFRFGLVFQFFEVTIGGLLIVSLEPFQGFFLLQFLVRTHGGGG